MRDDQAAAAPRRPPARGSLVTATLTVAVLAGACGPPPAVSHADRISARRVEKNAFFSQSPDSPIPSPERDEFLPLSYFAIDEAYAVPASLAVSAGEPAMEMPTSTGLRRQMRRAGTLRFSLKGEPRHLTAFVEAEAPDMNRLFVPFGDMTNGTETYAAGRYLDLDRSATGLYEIDFNLAYHPYCYYNPQYDCPYPPPENRLPTPIRAGERMRKREP